MIYLDLDDFCETNSSLELLKRLKEEIPGFRVNLFTIPGLCTPVWLSWVQQAYGSWVDLIPHGWAHTTPRECESWDASQCDRYFDWLGRNYPTLTQGWKAPGWQISGAMFQALRRRNWWLADQPYNRERRPQGLRIYELDSPNKLHGHIGHLGGYNANELSLIYREILKRREEPFGFIRDLMK